MTDLLKGANSFVPSVPLRVGVMRGLDASVLLLTEQGRVRGDADLVSRGRPVHPSGAVRHLGPHDGADWLQVDLPGVEAAVDRIVIAASSTGGPLGAAGPTVAAFAPDGTMVVRYALIDTTTETACVLGEFYRRAGGWKFRAVGQGWDSGPAGLAAEYGLEVAGTGAPGPAPEPAPAFAPPVPAPAPPTPFPAPAPPTPFPAPAAPAFAAYPPHAPKAGYAPVDPQVQQLRSGPAAPYVPAPAVPAVAPGGWSFGADFPVHTVREHGSQVVTAPGNVPPGPVLVELETTGGGYLSAYTLDDRNKDDKLVFNSVLKDPRHRMLVVAPEGRRLRIKVSCDRRWTLKILPLSAAPLLDGTLEGRGDEVVRYTGPPADLVFRAKASGNVTVYGYEVADAGNTLPDNRTLLVNEIGKVRTSSPMPPGPLLLRAQVDGAWTMKARPV
ncbi:TerD family protein [Streptomyces qinzhouensis]|uniref:TerD family protein n=2 Tax=Streptomyces qinzhouensis TaxID=2599401 RepID=A0A5B8JB32_9ACTN|nr:TerD family protein [Streptomyces qinzhouensis]